MVQFEKLKKGLECCASRICYDGGCPYHDQSPNYGMDDCTSNLTSDAIALIHQQQEKIKAQDEVIRALRKVGYPHNFQREPRWIVNYMYAITDVIKKAVKLE